MNDMVANNLALVQSDPALMNALQLRATDFFCRDLDKIALTVPKDPGSSLLCRVGRKSSTACMCWCLDSFLSAPFPKHIVLNTEVLGEKLPSLTIPTVKRILVDSGTIYKTAIHYIQHSPAA
jgi:hypothetical protein